MTALAPHITAFLQQRLAVERGASPHTCDSYAYAFQLLFTFAANKLKTTPAKLSIEQLDAPLVLQFLEYLQKERGNGARTRNARLAAIQSFMHFLEHRLPSALDQIRRIQAIPTRRAGTKIVPHLTADERQALLDAPDPHTRLGIRDRAMLYLALTGGLRVSELVGIRLDDITFSDRYVHVVVRGKGRRERALTLWREIGDALRAWLAVRGAASVPELFLNSRGEAMTRSGFECVIDRHVAIARSRCPSLSSKRVSPHVLRHTCAFNMLAATGDVRKVALWLGHAGIQTVEALSTSVAPRLRPGRFRPPDRLIAALRQP